MDITVKEKSGRSSLSFRIICITGLIQVIFGGSDQNPVFSQGLDPDSGQLHPDPKPWPR